MADLPFTLDQLRILRAIANEGSFKKAADSLYVTQPAVSLQIQNLEKQLDVSLFDRGEQQPPQPLPDPVRSPAAQRRAAAVQCGEGQQQPQHHPAAVVERRGGIQNAGHGDRRM